MQELIPRSEVPTTSAYFGSLHLILNIFGPWPILDDRETY